MKQTFAIGIGGAAGQGVATPGDIFAKIFSRRGLHLNAYNAYQSIIRGGHTFLTIRTGPDKVTNMGDRIDLLIPLNQDTMDRHLRLLTAGAACIYNADTIKPGSAADGVQLCPLPVSELADITRNKVAQNTLAIGAGPAHDGHRLRSARGRAARAVQEKGRGGGGRKRRRCARRLRLCRRALHGLPESASQDGESLRDPERQYGDGHGRRGRGREVLLRLPHEPFDRRSALDGGARAQSRHHGAPSGGRDRRDQYGDRRGSRRRSRHVRNVGRRLRADERRPRHVGHDGDPGGGDRLPASRPVDGRSHQDRAGRSVADAGRRFWRLSAGDRGSAGHRRLLQAHPRDLQRRRPLPVSGNRALRSAAVGRPTQRGSERSGFQPVRSIAANSSPQRQRAPRRLPRTATTNATRSPRAAFRRARFPACPATSTPCRPTNTRKTAC